MLKVGLIGCGGIGLGAYVPALLDLGDLYEVVAVADPQEEHRSEAGRRLGLPSTAWYADSRSLLDRSDVAAVVIATPPSVHAKLAESAARRGKHALVEKPLATRPSGAWAAVRAAEAAHVHLAVTHNYLYFREYSALKREVSRGAVGRVSVVIINALGVFDNRGMSEAGSYNWRHDAKVGGGGVLMDMIHLMYIAEHLLGEEVQRVSAHVARGAVQGEVEGLALCRLEGKRGVALVNVGWGDGPGGAWVSGDRGFLEARYQHGGTSPFAKLERVALWSAGTEKEIDVGPEDPGFSGILRDFAEAIRDGRCPLAPGAAGARTLEMTLAAYASAASGRTLDLPLAPESDVYKMGIEGLKWDLGQRVDDLTNGAQPQLEGQTWN